MPLTGLFDQKRKASVAFGADAFFICCSKLITFFHFLNYGFHGIIDLISKNFENLETSLENRQQTTTGRFPGVR